MAKVNISTHDPLVYTVMDEQTATNFFTKDYLDEYGIEISNELLTEYKKAYDEFWRVQNLIDKVMHR
jgi:hypothetical protein